VDCFSQVVEGGARWSPDFSFEIGTTVSVYPNVNQPEDFEGTSLGASVQGVIPFCIASA